MCTIALAWVAFDTVVDLHLMNYLHKAYTMLVLYICKTGTRHERRHDNQIHKKKTKQRQFAAIRRTSWVKYSLAEYQNIA